MKKLPRFMFPLITTVVVLCAWYLARPLTGATRFALPYPHEVISAGFLAWHDLLLAALQTLLAATIGFTAAIVLGFAMSVILALSGVVRSLVFPLVLALQMVPLVVMIPLIVLWMDGFPAIVLITFLMGFFPVVASTTQGLLSTDATLVEFFQLHRASRFQEMRYLRIPGALPYALTGAQIAATLAIVGALTGEIFASVVTGGRGGLGYLVIILRSEGNTAGMIAAGALACMLGFIFVGAVHRLRRRLLHKWHESALPLNTNL